MTNNELIRLVREAGFVKASAHYSGGNDEGGVDSVTFTRADGTTEEVDSWSPPENLSDVVKELESRIDSRYSFNGEGYVSGNLTVDVEKWTIEGEGHEEHSTAVTW